MLRDEVVKTLDLAIGLWQINSQWSGEAGSVSHIESCHIGGDHIARDFEIHMDQPHELCGGNNVPSPQEHLIAALAGCFISNFATVAILRNITLRTLNISIFCVCDMRGGFDLMTDGVSGFREMRFEVSVAG